MHGLIEVVALLVLIVLILVACGVAIMAFMFFASGAAARNRRDGRTGMQRALQEATGNESARNEPVGAVAADPPASVEH